MQDFRYSLTPLLHSPDFAERSLYLMSPYSHPDERVREGRAELADLISALLLTSFPCRVFSPISHSHKMAKICDTIAPGKVTWDRWMDIDLEILRTSSDIGVVILSPGWDESKGVAKEIDECFLSFKPVFGIIPGDELDSPPRFVKVNATTNYCVPE